MQSSGFPKVALFNTTIVHTTMAACLRDVWLNISNKKPKSFLSLFLQITHRELHNRQVIALWFLKQIFLETNSSVNFIKPLQLFVWDNSYKFLNQGGGDPLVSYLKRMRGSFYNKYIHCLNFQNVKMSYQAKKNLLNTGNIAMKICISDSNLE